MNGGAREKSRRRMSDQAWLKPRLWMNDLACPEYVSAKDGQALWIGGRIRRAHCPAKQLYQL